MNHGGDAKTPFRRRLLLLAMVCLAVGVALYGWHARPEFRLTILHTNDVHANYGGFDRDGQICYAPACPGGYGGSVRLKQAVKALREEDPAALFLDAGDQFQGTLYWNVHKEAVTVATMNMLGYDAFVPGNHEFDAGCGPFLNMARNLEFPVLAANLTLDIPGDPAASALVQPWTILERKGRSIGVVGLANRDTAHISSPCSGVRFSDEAEALQKAVHELTAKGVDIIIALSHIGLTKDRELARTVSGVDVIVGGHSHSLLANTLKEAEAPYPVVEVSPEGHPVLVTQAASAGRYLGRLAVFFDRRGVPTAWEGEPVWLTDQSVRLLSSPAPDQALASVIEEYSTDVRAMMRHSVGEIAARGREGKPLEETGVTECRRGECLTANLVTDALLRVPFKDAEIAVINAGAIRNSLSGGPVTPGDVLAALPFLNALMLAEMPGDVLLAMLETSTFAGRESSGSFLHTAGMRYALDWRNPYGERVTRAEIMDADGTWRRITPEGRYRVVTVDYLCRGGDGFTMLPGLEWRESPLLANDALRLYLERHSPLSPRLEDRITVVR